MKKIGKVLLLTLALTLCVGAMAVSASAADAIADADFNGGAMHWNISADGVLSITGTGAMPNYSSSVNAPWYPYRSAVKSITVGSGVTSLGNYAFYQMTSAISVTLASSVQTLGEYCFRECSSLKSVNLPEGISSIPSYCFYHCSSLEEIELPSTVRSFGYYAFYGCSSLKSIEIPEGVTNLRAYDLFGSCRSLKEIILPSTLQYLGGNGDEFYNTSITDIYFNGTLEQWLGISFGRYWNDLPMQSACNLYIGGEKLKNLTIPAGVTTVPSRAFRYVRLGSVTVAEDVELIGEGAFAYSTISSLWLDGVEMIGDYAFEYSNISSARLDGVTVIGGSAFCGSSVGTVLMTDSVTSVGTNAFANCTNLKKVYFVGDSSKWASIAWNTGNDALIDAPRTFVSSFADIRTVNLGAMTNGTVTLSTTYCVAGDTITLSAQPDLGYRLKTYYVNGQPLAGSSFVAQAGVDYVVTAEFEFYMTVLDHGDCGDNLEWLLFENNELVINGTGAMNGYNSGSNLCPWYNYRNQITALSVGSGVTSIGDRAFYNCTALTTVTLPEGLQTIGSDAFCDCDALTAVTLPDGLETIGGYAFRNCTALTAVTLPEGLETIGNGAFYNCTALKTITLPDGLQSIGGSAFHYCYALTAVTLPEGLETIGYYAFFDCNSLMTVRYAGTISDWLEISFDLYGPQYYAAELYIDGTLVRDLVIPSGTTEIPAYAFDGYGGLKTLSVPASVESIGDCAFCGCGLPYAEFAGNAPAVGSNVFGNTDNINGTAIYYHAGTSGWASPKWNGYYCAVIEAPSNYSALDDGNRNAQGILFTLNDSALTATVGDGSTTKNNAGYYGAQRGAVVIPASVTKGGKTYQVVGIGQYAFSENQKVTGVSIGSKVTSIIPTAFAACQSLQGITVDAANTYYSAVGGVLYDIAKDYLYVYPGGKTDTSFTVPSTVKTIGVKAFYDNEYLTKLTVGSSVTAIYSDAFCGLTNLAEITLPFVGNQADSSARFTGVFGYGTYGENCVAEIEYRDPVTKEWKYEWGTLKTVTIIGGTLYSNAFYNCGGIEKLTLPTTPETIPYRCFYNCTKLQSITFADTGYSCEIGELKLPEGIKTVEEQAFYGCRAITSVSIPKSLTSIDSSAFSGAGITAFSVASGNKSYATDDWGVLYSADKKTLVQYPSCRAWPYYNVLESAVSIGYQAFASCENLINLYVPKTAADFNYNAITNCPNLTLCCYRNSGAYTYALSRGITAWYMDGKTLSNISVYSTPEKTTQVEGRMDLNGLYIVGNYQGKELQIDGYTLEFDDSCSGHKTVTVRYEGKSASFEMDYLTAAEGNLIRFDYEENYAGKLLRIALYADGKMIFLGTAAVSGEYVQLGVSDTVMLSADQAVLYIFDSSFIPAMPSVVKDLNN